MWLGIARHLRSDWLGATLSVILVPLLWSGRPLRSSSWSLYHHHHSAPKDDYERCHPCGPQSILQAMRAKQNNCRRNSHLTHVRHCASTQRRMFLSRGYPAPNQVGEISRQEEKQWQRTPGSQENLMWLGIARQLMKSDGLGAICSVILAPSMKAEKKPLSSSWLQSHHQQSDPKDDYERCHPCSLHPMPADWGRA